MLDFMRRSTASVYVTRAKLESRTDWILSQSGTTLKPRSCFTEIFLGAGGSAFTPGAFAAGAGFASGAGFVSGAGLSPASFLASSSAFFLASASAFLARPEAFRASASAFFFVPESCFFLLRLPLSFGLSLPRPEKSLIILELPSFQRPLNIQALQNIAPSHNSIQT